MKNGSKRERTGTLETWTDAKGRRRYRARIRLADGTRPRIPVPAGFSEARARAAAEAWQQKEDREGALFLSKKRRGGEPSAQETVAEWSERWLDRRDELGHTTVGDDRGRLRMHILPLLQKPVAALTKSDIEGVRDALDVKVRAGQIAWKTATNTWAVLSKMCSDMANSKDRQLRVFEFSPAAGVQPTDRGIERSKPFLYPSELLAFVECRAIPRAWRSLVAVAVYTGLRAGELEALRWEDVDLDRGIISVHRSIDRSRGIAKETKSGKPRRFKMEAELIPLLCRMHDERTGDLVVEMPPLRDLAEKLRHYLAIAGVTRPELTARTATQKQLTFHDLRATACTWWSLRGDDPMKIMARAGHASFGTTQIYVRAAEVLRDDFGAVFPAVPT